MSKYLLSIDESTRKAEVCHGHTLVRRIEITSLGRWVSAGSNGVSAEGWDRYIRRSSNGVTVRSQYVVGFVEICCATRNDNVESSTGSIAGCQEHSNGVVGLLSLR